MNRGGSSSVAASLPASQSANGSAATAARGSGGEEMQRARMALDGLCACQRSLTLQKRFFVSSAAVAGDDDNPWTWELRCTDLTRVWEVSNDAAATLGHMRALGLPGDTIARYAARVGDAFRRGELTVVPEGSVATLSLLCGNAVHVYSLSESPSSSAVGDFVEALARNAADAALLREQRDTAVRELSRCIQQQQQQQQLRQQLPRAGTRSLAAARQRNRAVRTAGGSFEQNRALLHPAAAKRSRPAGARIVPEAEEDSDSSSSVPAAKATKTSKDDDDDDLLL